MFALTILLACQEAPEPAALVEMACHNNGDPEACFKLGTEQLNSARPDYSEARRLLSMACSTHHAQACNALGTLVRDARGGPKDLVRAADLFEVACEKGVPQGCVHFADALRTGQGVERDEEKAQQYYRQTCETDSPIPAACTRLAVGMRDAKGAKREDKEKAHELLEAACKSDYPQACVELADEAKDTWGKDNLARAAQLYETACTIDPHYGCFELATMHVEKKAPDSNVEQAGHYYQQVCRIESSRGCFELAELMSSEQVPSRPGEKEALYKLACESGNSDACTKR
ncbi:MAG: sel1 repeat family protein [Myxococcales bacterium]|nr:sel1 repeat family protein [Myxococcales bacterium]MCB9668491.1 sel1 repeat family protein [Alphaproteobacteria bacterium]MCB9690729.1 sel1 repeat family protein [Alphaproteobacteria bacterium]